MLAVTAKIAIVGLCTLMNAENKNAYVTPAALIIPKADGDVAHGGLAHPHIAFIAWDESMVDPPTLTGVSKVRIKDDQMADTSYYYVALDGDWIEIENLVPIAGPGDLTTVPLAIHSDYWRYVPSPKAYDSRYVPQGANRLGYPDDGYVAGFFRFGMNPKLTSTRPTRQPWQFKDMTSSNYTVKNGFAQEVDYEIESQVDGNNYGFTKIILHDLAGTATDRTILLKAHDRNKNYEIFVGNATAMGMYFLVARKPTKPEDDCRSTHFRAIHMMAHTTEVKEWPIPEPETPGANCSGGSGDTTGYCGPDGKP